MRPQTLGGGTNSYKVGALKRRLDAVVLATFDKNQTSSLGTIAQQLVLKNLNGDLNIQIAGSFSTPDSGVPILPSAIPAGAVTMQLTPAVLTPNAGRVFLRPVFQNPAIVGNANNPLPQDVPFGWEFSTEADEVYIDFSINSTAFSGGNLNGQLICAVTIEYNGDWWATDAVKYAIGQVQLTGCKPPLIGTAPS